MDKMTGYQKLKMENEILWTNLKMWLQTIASNYYKDDDPRFKEFVDKEIAYVERQIKLDTH